MKYLGESQYHNKPILLEIVDFKGEPTKGECTVFRLDIDTSTKHSIVDVSGEYNNDAIKEFSK